ncbi:hypothetical protein LTR85_000870 [Meristemomyces frigidus]|nr:hypothetical protein LTR85_000870 [Meristemomyces frigidus]
MISEEEAASFEAFADGLSTTVIARLAPDGGKGTKKRAVKGRKNEIKPVAKVAQSNGDDIGDAAELSEFVQYLAEEIFASLPTDLRTLSYSAVQENAGLLDKYSVPLDTALLEGLMELLPPTAADSLSSYGLIQSDLSNLDRFIEPVLESYIITTSAPPPEYTPAIAATRPSACEICEREHLPLTYHHLIPRQMHAKAVKRGWHKEWELNKVAWLCRACHSYVHKVATNEELARELYSVELMTEREDVQKWATWVGRVRWKSR